MPFSAVIVGVGNGDFTLMKILDADETVLEDTKGNVACRDIVQLVKYEDFKDLGMRELAFEVLGEVPDQFVDYQVMREQQPERLFKLQEQDVLELDKIKQDKEKKKGNPFKRNY